MIVILFLLRPLQYKIRLSGALSRTGISTTQRLSSAVMTIAGCGGAEDHADASQYGLSSLKLSLVHNDSNFQGSIKEGMRTFLALASKDY